MVVPCYCGACSWWWSCADLHQTAHVSEILTVFKMSAVQPMSVLFHHPETGSTLSINLSTRKEHTVCLVIYFPMLKTHHHYTFT